MASWVFKAAVQGAISVLPGGNRVNYLLQRHITHSLPLGDQGFVRKVEQCRRHIANYQACSQRATPALSALELGTGWYPIIPIGLALTGVQRVQTVDIARLVNLERTREALQQFAQYLRTGELHRMLPSIDSDRAKSVIALSSDQTARDPLELLEPLGVRLMVGDAQRLTLPPRSVDLFVSNNTLEHVAPDVLAQILVEFRRLAGPNAVMSHFIDISDHYWHFDRSITPFNYMRYTDRSWRLLNNRLQYQNRLQACDYRELIKGAGFDVSAEDPEIGTCEDLDRVPLAPRFRGYRREDLLILRTWITAVAPRSHA